MSTANALIGFESRFNHAPAGAWSAPGQVTIMGNPTPDGFAFSVAIDERECAAVSRRSDGLVRIATPSTARQFALEELLPENLHGWSAIPLRVAWLLARFAGRGGRAAGFEAYLDSEIPQDAESALAVAIRSVFAIALNDVWQLGLDRRELAGIGALADGGVRLPTNDQAVSLLTHADSAVFLDGRSLEAELVSFALAASGLDLLLIELPQTPAATRAIRAARRASCAAAAARLHVDSLRDLSRGDLAEASLLLDDETFRRVRHVVTENARVLQLVRTVRAHGPGRVGRVLDASEQSLRDDFGTTSPELDLAVSTARVSGAIGARMTGSGFERSALALTPHEFLPAVEVAVEAAFALRGFAPPRLRVVHVDEGASRDQ